MNLKIFAYKGVLGAESDLKKGKFINSPNETGQMGIVVATNNVDITKEAKELLRKAPKESGSFAPIMLTKHDDNVPKEHGKSSIGLFGFHKHAFGGEDLAIGRTCDVSILDDCNEVEMELDEEFKKYVDTVSEDIK